MARFGVLLAGLTALIWAGGAFVLWQADPGLWSVADRGLAVWVWFFGAVVCALVVWRPR